MAGQSAEEALRQVIKLMRGNADLRGAICDEFGPVASGRLMGLADILAGRMADSLRAEAIELALQRLGELKTCPHELLRFAQQFVASVSEASTEEEDSFSFASIGNQTGLSVEDITDALTKQVT